MLRDASEKKKASSSSSSEAFLREQLEAYNKEVKLLKQRIDSLEKENQQLKKSVYDLSFRSSSGRGGTSVGAPFDIDAALEAASAALPPPNDIQANAAATPATPASAMGGKDKDAKLFSAKHELKGHTGAVYAVQFSHDGRFLVSGSFDKSVRVWDTTNLSEVKRFDKHALNVSDVVWSGDSTQLLSGGYDQTCMIWDVEAGKSNTVNKVDGLVQCVAFAHSTNDVYFAGTSRKFVYMFDKRKPADQPPVVLTNNAMINSMLLFRDDVTLLTGDSSGILRTWDIRTGKSRDSFQNETSKKPISHVSIAKPPKNDEEDSKYFAVNSYDNVLRVYDRGTTLSPFAPTLVHSLKAHRNQNWPIRSSFFVGSEYTGSAQTSASMPSSNSLADEHDEMHPEINGAGVSKGVLGPRTLDQSMLLASGSADAYAYVYDVSGREGTAELVQRLEGHTDRVYATAFHPSKPLLATGSADFTIKLWGSKAKSSMPTLL